MPANMWRIPVSKVVKSGSAIIQDRGVLRSAATASTGNYLFSEVGAGTQALALIGMWKEVLDFLSMYPNRCIDNRISDLPEIYMAISYYKPGERFTGLFPVQDAIQQIVKGVASFVPGNDITDVAGAIGDSVGFFQEFFGKSLKKKSPANNLVTTPIYVKFSYLQERGMVRVGSRNVSFRTLYQVVVKTLADMV